MSSVKTAGTSASSAQRFNFDTIHCWTCYRDYPIPAFTSRDGSSNECFWLTSCSHVICSKCMRDRGDPASRMCPHCKATGIKQIVLNEDLPGHILPFFHSPASVLEDVVSAYRFQHEHTLHLISYLKAQARKQQEILEHVASELKEAREMRKAFRLLEKENAELKAQLGQLAGQGSDSLTRGNGNRHEYNDASRAGGGRGLQNDRSEFDLALAQERGGYKRLREGSSPPRQHQLDDDFAFGGHGQSGRQPPSPSGSSESAKKLASYAYRPPATSDGLARQQAPRVSSESRMPPPNFIRASRLQQDTLRPASALGATNSRFSPVQPSIRTTSGFQPVIPAPQSPAHRAPFRPATATSMYAGSASHTTPSRSGAATSANSRGRFMQRP